MSLLQAKRVKLLVAVAICAAIILVLAVPSFRHQLSGSVTRKPAEFTELYFTDATHLPKHVVAGTPASVAFSIVNHEARTVEYSYLVTAQSSQGTTTIAQGSVRLLVNQRADKKVAFTPDAANRSYLITVALAGRTELIHFAAAS